MARYGPIVSDETVFAAVVDVISDVGPTELTLARIGARAGLTAGALVQRFGSKHGVLAAFAARSVENVHQIFADASRRHPGDSWAAAVEGLVAMAAELHDRRAFAHHLGWFALELADDQLRPFAVDHHRSVQRELARLLGGPVAARQLHAVYQGALILWALEDGAVGLSPFLRRELRRAAAAFMPA